MINKKVAVIGSLNYDIILKQDRLANIGETISVNEIFFSSGGKGANQAVQCAKLELETFMIGKVGNDSFGDALLNSLKKYNVNTDFISKTGTNSGIGIVNSFPDGSLLSTISKGANFDITKDDIDKAEEVIKTCSIVILQLEIPLEVVEYAVKLAKYNGCYIVLNAAPSYELSKEVMALIDCFVVNESEAGFYVKNAVKSTSDAVAAAKYLYGFMAKLVIVTLGEKGSILYDGSKHYFIQPEEVNVVETTGAGDSYIGAVVYGLINSFTLEEIGKFASKVSSKTITKIGGQEAMPTLEEVPF